MAQSLYMMCELKVKKYKFRTNLKSIKKSKNRYIIFLLWTIFFFEKKRQSHLRFPLNDLSWNRNMERKRFYKKSFPLSPLPQKNIKKTVCSSKVDSFFFNFFFHFLLLWDVSKNKKKTAFGSSVGRKMGKKCQEWRPKTHFNFHRWTREAMVCLKKKNERSAPPSREKRVLSSSCAQMTGSPWVVTSGPPCLLLLSVI